VQAHPNAIGRFLRKLGLRTKKVAGRDRATPRQGKKQRDDWFRHRLPAVRLSPNALSSLMKPLSKPT
jgi:hypothetical protein